MRFRLDGWDPGPTGAGDEADWRTRTALSAPVDGELVFDGLATLCSVLVDGEVAAESESMWVPVRVPVTAGEHTVEVVCHALAPRLAERRKPRARWRQKVAADGNLRWFRTTLLGRAPGFAPGPPVVGLWRPAWFVAGEPQPALRPRVEGTDGVVYADGEEVTRIADVERWWPHTHGEPRLYDVEAGRVGFRTIEAPGDVLRDGLTVRVNGVPVFVRGAVWTPVPDDELRPTLEAARDAGLNCIRLPGTGVYESPAFHDLCDELGLLVWQDLMFANLDYPFEQLPVAAELDALIDVVGGRPSLAVVCGGSEIEQQVEMLGLDPALGRPPFLAEEVPARLRAAGVDAVYVPSAPCGATRALRPDEGISNWFGVGGYRRPLGDARAAGVRFASECLALANVADDGDLSGSMRDVDSPWDFLDVTRHYLAELYGPEAGDDLLPWVSGDVMAEVLGEWRRAGSPCGGALILWLRDLAPGAGWGLLDHRGAPKAVLGALARVLAPVAIWTTDEGLGGIAVHVANDRPEPLRATVRVTLYRDYEHVVEEATAPIEVPAHGSWTGDVEALLRRWVDAAYAYRFGEPQHDLVVAALDEELTAEREPAGRSAARHSATDLGVSAVRDGDVVRITSRRALLGARLGAAQFLVEPGRERVVPAADGELTARNLAGSVRIG
ncbi:MAG: beta-mannosidase [Solirubrobacteraceae bacterium]|nr:beta-mannosidase [Solirubrobacteraceae bacterium]